MNTHNVRSRIAVYRALVYEAEAARTLLAEDWHLGGQWVTGRQGVIGAALDAALDQVYQARRWHPRNESDICEVCEEIEGDERC